MRARSKFCPDDTDVVSRIGASAVTFTVSRNVADLEGQLDAERLSDAEHDVLVDRLEVRHFDRHTIRSGLQQRRFEVARLIRDERLRLAGFDVGDSDVRPGNDSLRVRNDAVDVASSLLCPGRHRRQRAHQEQRPKSVFAYACFPRCSNRARVVSAPTSGRGGALRELQNQLVNGAEKSVVKAFRFRQGIAASFCSEMDYFVVNCACYFGVHCRSHPLYWIYRCSVGFVSLPARPTRSCSRRSTNARPRRRAEPIAEPTCDLAKIVLVRARGRPTPKDASPRPRARAAHPCRSACSTRDADRLRCARARAPRLKNRLDTWNAITPRGLSRDMNIATASRVIRCVGIASDENASTTMRSYEDSGIARSPSRPSTAIVRIVVPGRARASARYVKYCGFSAMRMTASSISKKSMRAPLPAYPASAPAPRPIDSPHRGNALRPRA